MVYKYKNRNKRRTNSNLLLSFWKYFAQKIAGQYVNA